MTSQSRLWRSSLEARGDSFSHQSPHSVAPFIVQALDDAGLAAAFGAGPFGAGPVLPEREPSGVNLDYGKHGFLQSQPVE